MKIQLIDRNIPLCSAWTTSFHGTDIEVIVGNIFDTPTDCIVSPANSFGFMDGGIDYAISENLGWGLQERLKDRILNKYNGELLVGQAEFIETYNEKIPYCISAPTMRVPLIITDTINVYLAMRAILLVLKQHSEINTVSIPGLGTGVGQVNYHVCAAQMKQAYDDIWLNNYTYPQTLRDASVRHDNL